MFSREAAIAFIPTIPAVAAVYKTAHAPFVAMLVDATKGETPEQPPRDFYRVWITAYRYLQQSPDLFLVKKHDRTELGSYQSPLQMLLEQQAAEDTLNELIVPPGQQAIALEADHFTVSVRAGVEF
jgi:hypothetical protein